MSNELLTFKLDYHYHLENVKKWAEKWLVDFNPGKTKSMTISNKTTVHPPLTFNGNVLDEVTSNKHKSWELHFPVIYLGQSILIIL